MWVLLCIQLAGGLLHSPVTTSSATLLEDALTEIPDTIAPYWTVTSSDTLINKRSAWAGRVYADTNGRFVQVDIRVYNATAYPSAVEQYCEAYDTCLLDTAAWNYRTFAGYHEYAASFSNRIKIRINAVSAQPRSMLQPIQQAIPLKKLQEL